MDKKQTTKFYSKLISTTLVFCIILWLAYTFGNSSLLWYSIVPPLLAVSLAIVTNRVLPSLLSAILVGGLLNTLPKEGISLSQWTGGVSKGISFIWASITDITYIQIMAFIVFVMAMISVLLTNGGLQGIVNWLMKFATTIRSTKLVTVCMGLILFIDDYSNTMLVGTTLRPLTDRQKISREKLAFLVDATSAPIAGLAVISTWIGYEVGLFEQTAQSLGLNQDGYSMFFDALGFRFYCIFMVIFVLLNSYFGKDYGPMAIAENRAQSTGAVSAEDSQPITSKSFANSQASAKANITALSALLPVGCLFTFLIAALWVDGGGMEKLSQGISSLFSFAAWKDVFKTSENSILILAYAGAIGAVVSVFTSLVFARIPFSTAFKAFGLGIRSSLLPIAILISAWSLKGACDSLETGKFLATTLGQSISPIIFPALVFLVAGMTAFATGTSWGTMAILIPTAIPVAFQLDGSTYSLVTIISLGAVLDGAIFGDHCSPISDTTIMSSISSNCDHIHHVRTQLPYALTVAAAALFLGYIPASMGMPSWVGIVLATGAIALLFYVLKMETEKSSIALRKATS